MATLAPPQAPGTASHAQVEALIAEITAADPAEGIDAARFIQLGRLIERDAAEQFCAGQYAQLEARTP